MEIVDRLEERFNELLNKIGELKEENQRLTEQVEAEKQTKRDIESRIDTLLEKIQNELK
jgi:cell division protein ZapB